MSEEGYRPPAYPLAEPADRLPIVEQNILAYASTVVLAEELLISETDAVDLLAAAHDQGRVAIVGNNLFAGVQVDGQWIVVKGRDWLRHAAQAYMTLQYMERQFDE
jgi:hypothetical protein